MRRLSVYTPDRLGDCEPLAWPKTYEHLQEVYSMSDSSLLALLVLENIPEYAFDQT